MRPIARHLLSTLLVFSAACGGDAPTGPGTGGGGGGDGGGGGGGAAVTLQLTLSRDSLVLDRWADTATVAATVRDQNGNSVTGASVSWQSVEQGVATVSANGVVQSVGLGTGTVRVTASRTGSDPVTRDLPVRVALQPNAACTVPSAITRGAANGTVTLGQWQFLPNIPIATHDGSRAIAVDYDGDGDKDIVRLEYSFPTSTPYTGTVRVFRNDGGTLVDATASVVAGTIVPDHPRDFEVADFSGDGAEDLFVAQHGFDAVPFPGAPELFLTRNGSQLADRFSSSFSPASTNAFSHGSSRADVDCDGDLDIAMITVSQAAPNRLFLNNGSGQFTAAPSTALGEAAATNPRWQEAAFIDFDMDGDPDLFLGARSGNGGNEDLLLVNDGSGRFRRRANVRVPSPHFTPNHAINNAKSADFDGDGRPDLLIFEIPAPFSTTSRLRLWKNGGDGTFTDVSTTWGIPAVCGGELIEPLYVQDINRDGWPDVLVPNGCPELGGTGILVNAGNRFNFVPYSSAVSWLGADTPTPVDLDGNGSIELFFGERGGDVVLVPVQ